MNDTTELNPIPLAFDAIKVALKNDSAYAHSWHCNLAMPIYDEAREPSCQCPYAMDHGYKNGRHDEACPVVVHRLAVFDGKKVEVSHEQANEMASRLMQHIFGVTTSNDMLAVA